MGGGRRKSESRDLDSYGSLGGWSESGDFSESVAAVQNLAAVRAGLPRASALDCGDEACVVTALAEAVAPNQGRADISHDSRSCSPSRRQTVRQSFSGRL